VEEGRAKYQFGAVRRLQAEAIGEPGHRVFRILLESGAASACLWLEKEQLHQLALYIHEIIASLSSGAQSRPEEVPEPEWTGEATTVELKVGKLALGHDSSSNCFFILVHESEEGEEGPAALRFWATLTQVKELADEAIKVCAAGRPRCFLCGQPINPDGHMCPRSNGHTSLEA